MNIGVSSNNLNSLFAGASYYKLASQYAIKQKYAHAAASSTQHTTTKNPTTTSGTNTSSTNKTSSTSKEATNFLSEYSSDYNSLKTATKNLKTKINDEAATTEAKISAVQDYVKAYNSTLSFLEDHSGDNTYSLNRLKGSLEAIPSINSSFSSGMGLSQNADGTLSVDTAKLTKALTNNATSATRSLSSLAGITEAHTNLASNTSNAKLLKEQNMLKTNPASTSENDASYNDFMALASNTLALKNFYYGLACSGTFMDISI